MAEEMAIAVADGADLVLNGYAVTRSEGNFRVVNLKTGKAAYVMASGELSETNMDDVEAGIVTCLVAENRRYLGESEHA